MKRILILLLCTVLLCSGFIVACNPTYDGSNTSEESKAPVVDGYDSE